MGKEEIKRLSNNKEVIALFSNEGRHRDDKNETISLRLTKQHFSRISIMMWFYNFSVIHNKVEFKVRF